MSLAREMHINCIESKRCKAKGNELILPTYSCKPQTVRLKPTAANGLVFSPVCNSFQVVTKSTYISSNEATVKDVNLE